MSAPITRQHWLFGGAVVVIAGVVGWAGGRLGGSQVGPGASQPMQEATVAAADPAPAGARPATPSRHLPALPARGSLAPARSQADLVAEPDSDARERALVSLVRSGAKADRIEALTALHAEYPERAVEVAHDVIAERVPEVADHAARVLHVAKKFGPEDVAAMQSMVADTSLSDDDRTGANAAVMAMLRAQGGPELESWARKSLTSDVAWVRGSTVAAVATLPTLEAVPLLAEALDDPDPAVAAGALNALTGMHGGDAKLGTDPAAWKQWAVEREAARVKAEQDAVALRDAKPAVIPGSGEAPAPPEPPSFEPTVESAPPTRAEE